MDCLNLLLGEWTRVTLPNGDSFELGCWVCGEQILLVSPTETGMQGSFAAGRVYSFSEFAQ
jgi:hypothetical protein